MDLSNIAFLAQEIHGRLECACIHQQSVRVKQQYKGRVLWEGVVNVFRLLGHPAATTCFAWATDELLGTSSPVIFLKTDHVSTPGAAVSEHIRQLCLEMAA